MKRGCVCVVTGGSSGIGRALSVALARRGCSVAVVARDRDRIDATLADLARVGESWATPAHLGLALDVTNPDDMRRMAEQCSSRLGRIDVLIASAGIGRAPGAASRLPSPTTDLTLAEWEGILAVNLHGVFLSNQAVLPMMIEQGDGDIINICSSTTPMGLRGRPFAPAYSASKFAVASFTEVLMREVEGYGIRVNAVFPGPVETPLIENTLLDRPFGGRMDMADFAETVLGLLDFAPELAVGGPHVLPLPLKSKRSPG